MQNEKTEKPGNLVDAINYVMERAKGVEKSLTVGTGNNSYQGVSDKDVKELVQPLLVEAGLVILPIKIEPTTTLDTWDEVNQYNGREVIRKKLKVITEVKTTYLLQHVSGETVELQGLGQGIDNGDKAPGKATTYALKYLMLYLFQIPTGKIDDADGNASDPVEEIKEKKTISPEDFKKALDLVRAGRYTPQKVADQYALDEDQLRELDELNNELKNANNGNA